jgi:hypothetical protein
MGVISAPPPYLLTSSTYISEENMPDIRKETDALGVREVPADRL